MRIFIVVGLALACTACATPGDVAGKAPFATYASGKDPQALAGCIAPKVTAEWPQTRVIPIDGGQRILASGSAFGDVIAAVDVKAAQKGSNAEIRQGAGRMGVLTGIIDSVKACQ